MDHFFDRFFVFVVFRLATSNDLDDDLEKG